MGALKLSYNEHNISVNDSDYSFLRVVAKDGESITPSLNSYVFGSPMPGRQLTSSAYRYGFNGKENDSETGTQDYGERIYNPTLGKFLSVDPLTGQYPWNSTYAFAENDVIRFIDLDGAEKTKPAVYTVNKGWTTAIDNTGRGALPDNVIRIKMTQAMKKENPYLNIKPTYQGEIKQGGIYSDPDYIASTTIMDNECSVMVPFYDPGKSLLKGEKVTKEQLIYEASFEGLAFIPFGKVGGKIIKAVAHSFKYADDVTHLIKSTSKLNVDGVVGKEIITQTTTGKFSTAIDVAKNILGDLGDDAVEKFGKFGSQENKVVGWQSADGSKGWRIDYDDVKGAHINWWDGNKKGAVMFNSSQGAVDSIIKNEIPKALN